MKLFVLSLFCCCILKTTVADVESDFKAYGIIPDTITDAPSEMLMVKYESLTIDRVGVETTTSQLEHQPTFIWNADTSSFYTLVIYDIDPATGRENRLGTEFQYLLVVNIPGMNVDQGETLTLYHPPSPTKKTGFHRIVSLVYKQPGKLDYSDEKYIGLNTMYERLAFCMRKFAEKYNLGKPVAGNMLQVDWDDSVTVFNKKFMEGKK